jgi:hypothetical protein
MYSSGPLWLADRNPGLYPVWGFVDSSISSSKSSGWIENNATEGKPYCGGVMLTDSVPGHLVFNHLQTFKTALSFHFVPIPGAPEFAHGMNCG